MMGPLQGKSLPYYWLHLINERLNNFAKRMMSTQSTYVLYNQNQKYMSIKKKNIKLFWLTFQNLQLTWWFTDPFFSLKMLRVINHMPGFKIVN